MTRNVVPTDATFGYLSTWESPESGCLGGYLIVSHLGRPLEFHCTAPIRLSRAQQILYGATLWPFVFGEQIGARLLSEAKIRPILLLVDHPATLCLRARFGIPIVRPKSEAARMASHDRLRDVAGAAGAAVSPFVVDESAFEAAPGFEDDCGEAAAALSRLAKFVDVVEPFTRIYLAIREAHRLGAGDEVPHERAA
jgi:hypothetical protein